MTIIIQLFSEKRDWRSRVPIGLVLILIWITLVLPQQIQDYVFPVLLFSLVGWCYIRVAKRDVTEIVRMSLLFSLGIAVILGNFIGYEAFQLISSLLITRYLILENTLHFNRVIALFKNVSITSITDSLTRLYNRAFFFKKAVQLLVNNLSVLFL